MRVAQRRQAGFPGWLSSLDLLTPGAPVPNAVDGPPAAAATTAWTSAGFQSPTTSCGKMPMLCSLACSSDGGQGSLSCMSLAC